VVPIIKKFGKDKVKDFGLMFYRLNSLITDFCKVYKNRKIVIKYIYDSDSLKFLEYDISDNDILDISFSYKYNISTDYESPYKYLTVSFKVFKLISTKRILLFYEELSAEFLRKWLFNNAKVEYHNSPKKGFLLNITINMCSRNDYLKTKLKDCVNIIYTFTGKI